MNLKKIVALLLSLCAVLTVVVLPASAADTVTDEFGRVSPIGTVYTPAGSETEVIYRTGEMTVDEIAGTIALRAAYIKAGATAMADSTLAFNCHSFTFLSQDVRTNTMWLNTPQTFINDGSYIQIDEPVQGCVAVYCYESTLTFETTTLTDDGEKVDVIILSNELVSSHSALVIGVDPGDDGVLEADEIELVSKWGLNGIFRHTQALCPYAEVPEDEASSLPLSETVTISYCLRYGDMQVRYYIPNPALYSGLTFGTDTLNRQGLYQDGDGIRYYVAGEPYAAGVVSDADGNYYYIDDSLKAVTDNDSVQISLNDTNGLLPDGVYSVDGDGRITNLPTVLVGESYRDGVVKLADGQIKTMKDGYPTAGIGAYTDGENYFYFESTPICFGTYEDGETDFSVMTTDGIVEATVSGTRNNGILPVYEWEVDENGMITELPVKLDSQSDDFGTGLMRLPDGTVVLYKNGVAQVDATSYTDPATGKKYNFTYGGTTYSVVTTVSKARLINRLKKAA